MRQQLDANPSESDIPSSTGLAVVREDERVDRAEAQGVAEEVLAQFIERRTHRDLVALLEQSVWVDRTGPSGTTYAVKLSGMWDGDGDGVLRVQAAAMDGSTRLGFASNVVVDELIDPPPHEPSGARRRSPEFVRACIGQFVPLAVLTAGLLWLGVIGYPGLGVLGLLLAVASGRIAYAAVRGGVRYPGHQVETRGITWTQRLDRGEIRAVHVRRVRNGQPSGWFDTIGRPVRIRGITFAHGHGVFDRKPCHTCIDFEDRLQQVAADLDVDLIVDPPG